jgi:hypothetical protein
MAKPQTEHVRPEELEKELERLRNEAGLRSLTESESGSGIDQVPAGTYGFTYSACEDNFPLFIEASLRSFETHKHADGSVYLIGFLTSEDEHALSGAAAATIRLFPEPKDAANRLCRLPLTRVQSHVENSARSGKGLEVRLRPSA